MGEKLAEEEREIVTPGEILGKAVELKAGKGTYVSADGAGVSYVYASLTGRRSLLPPPPDSPDKVRSSPTPLFLRLSSRNLQFAKRKLGENIFNYFQG